MVCENCRGARYINGLPCQSCAGSGLQHCCEGPVGNAADIPPGGYALPLKIELVPDDPPPPNDYLTFQRDQLNKIAKTFGLPPELPETEDFDECEWCEDFDECLSVGHCIDGN